MSEAEAIEKLKALDALHDNEMEHVKADDILCEFLCAKGYTELVTQFKKRAEAYWYA